MTYENYESSSAFGVKVHSDNRKPMIGFLSDLCPVSISTNRSDPRLESKGVVIQLELYFFVNIILPEILVIFGYRLETPTYS